MTRFFLRAGFLALAASSLWAAPVVSDGGILNAASYANPRLPSGALGQGSIFVIFGSGLGPAALLQASSLPLGTTLGGTSVRVSAGGQNLDCPMVYTSAGQVAAILPSNTPVGQANVTVTFNGETSAPRSIRVANSSFGIFSLNQRGSGPGVMTNFESAVSQPVNTVLKPARPGQVITLYGTGLGPLPAGNSDAAAAPAVQINNNLIEVLVGSRRANVTYAGRAPGFVGLDQINFVVPEGSLGCAVAVLIRVGTQVSNAASMAISQTGGFCSDPFGLPVSVLERLSNGQTSRVGFVALNRTSLDINIPGAGSFNSTTDTGIADFTQYSPQDVILSSSLNVGNVPSLGSCIVFTGTVDDTSPDDPVSFRGLDAGPQITINGPVGTRTLTKSNPFDGSYFRTLGGGIAIPIPGAPQPEPLFLNPGNYTITGPGGPDVGAFTAQYTMPQPLVWTNRNAITNVNRSNPLEVTWTGGGPNDNVCITGYSVSEASERAITGIFICTERASAGRFTIPAAVLLTLPPSPTTGDIQIPGALSVGAIHQERTFNAPGLDYGVTSATTLTGKSVSYQ